MHDLLHLAGHDDVEADQRAAMESAQETIVSRLWTPDLQARLAV